MKKTFVLLAGLMLSTAALHAQTTETTVKSTETKQKEEGTDGSKTKVKPKTTVKDKAYNAVHRNKKRSHGVKAKGKDADGNKIKASAKTDEQQ
ncbi:MAG: hypothetical protein EOP50_02240 [Sphingobacteriales bacterium]|nr:MAG: hypothetical protein EOP50_02240 [Sphingobacteriales bacterium]